MSALSLRTLKFGELLHQEDWEPEHQLYDVIFQVVDDESGGVEGELRAHQLLLSLVSPVFRNLFAKSDKDEEREKEGNLYKFVIEGFSFTSFESFIRFLYSGEEEDLLDLDIINLFHIFQLADHYQVRGMKPLVRCHIQRLEIDAANLTDAFKVLLKYHTNYTCEDVCKDIYRKCLDYVRDVCISKEEAVKYLQGKIGDEPKKRKVVMKKLLDDFDLAGSGYKRSIEHLQNENKKRARFNSVKETDGEEDESVTIKDTDLLMKIEEHMKELKELKGPLMAKMACSNCKMLECQDGKQVTSSSIYPGLAVGDMYSTDEDEYHKCKYHPTEFNSDELSLTQTQTKGKFTDDYSVEWFEDEESVRVRCACTKDSDHNNIVYRCKETHPLNIATMKIEKHLQQLVKNSKCHLKH